MHRDYESDRFTRWYFFFRFLNCVDFLVYKMYDLLNAWGRVGEDIIYADIRLIDSKKEILTVTMRKFLRFILF